MLWLQDIPAALRASMTMYDGKIVALPLAPAAFLTFYRWVWQRRAARAWTLEDVRQGCHAAGLRLKSQLSGRDARKRVVVGQRRRGGPGPWKEVGVVRLFMSTSLHITSSIHAWPTPVRYALYVLSRALPQPNTQTQAGHLPARQPHRAADVGAVCGPGGTLPQRTRRPGGRLHHAHW